MSSQADGHISNDFLALSIEETRDDFSKGVISNNQVRFVDVYCLIFKPRLSHHYQQWALAFSEPEKADWWTIEAVQDKIGAPYYKKDDRIHPKDITGNQKPLTYLGRISPFCFDKFVDGLGMVELPGRKGKAPTDSRDYVLDIWNMMWEKGMVDKTMWEHGKSLMHPHYRQMYGQEASSKGQFSFDED